MNKLRKLLPALALMLGAFAAVAFTEAPVKLDASTVIFAEDPLNPGQYIDVTDAVSEERFNCESSALECRVTFTNNDPINGTKTVLQMGEFEELP
ncbi:DUF6520 family protein [Algoriphagus formosus]|uniref:DUF1573 domain-containing protein n=1 Tax=Algoriphagus formosus TaxID=2007308 RepID=A0A4R5UW39_9BACT|nr:DUF6520 family protein [Algoriphagus aquimaris]TDK43341.1 hypothetical protein E1898_12070 [Algoriphagus aquimaris]